MKKVPWWRISFGEEELKQVSLAIANEQISQGALTEQFEQQICEVFGVPYAIATTNGSAALLLSFLALGLKPGDEVIVPDRTFIATAHAVQLAGGTVRLVDCERDRPNIDVNRVEHAITSRTRAIAVVHLNGRASDMNALHDIARRHGLALVEDAAQAILSKHERGFLGTLGDFGCFSLGVSKLIATGQGGIVITHSSQNARKLRLLKNHGVEDTFKATYSSFGFNLKFTDLAAAIGIVQLNRREEKRAHVIEVYKRYRELLGDVEGVTLLPVAIERGEVPVYVELLSPNRDELLEFLDANGIQCRRFLPSLHYSPHLPAKETMVHSELFHHQGLFLPAGPALPLEFVDQTVAAIKLFRPNRHAQENLENPLHHPHLLPPDSIPRK